MLTLNDETHEYSMDGRKVPGVSEVLRAEHLLDENEWITEYYLTRGRYVHEACELNDRGELGEETIDPAIAGFLVSWRGFLSLVHPTFVEIEEPHYHQDFDFAGKPDRIVRIGEKVGPLDIKTGGPRKWHCAQLGGYCILGGWDFAVNVYLDADGAPGKLKAVTPLARYRSGFLAALTLFRFKQER